MTATRVAREDYDAPTPTTVLGQDQLELKPSGTLADTLALLPMMRNPEDEGTGSLVFGVVPPMALLFALALSRVVTEVTRPTVRVLGRMVWLIDDSSARCDYGRQRLHAACVGELRVKSKSAVAVDVFIGASVRSDSGSRTQDGDVATSWPPSLLSRSGLRLLSDARER
jgi:hypothetical protein